MDILSTNSYDKKNNLCSLIQFQSIVGTCSFLTKPLAWLAVYWIKRQWCSLPTDWETNLKVKRYSRLTLWLREMKKYLLKAKLPEASTSRLNLPARYLPCITVLLSECIVLLQFWVRNDFCPIASEFEIVIVVLTSVSLSGLTRMHAIRWELFIRTNVFLSSFKSRSSLWDDESLHFSLSLSLRENIWDSKSNK